jgi:Domain of unknown function (DUF4041)/T5orf172 domain
MFTALLLFLLLLAIGGLVVLGTYTLQLRTRVARLDEQQEKHDDEITQWNEYSVSAKAQHQSLVSKHGEDTRKWNEHLLALKAENQRLSKWKNVANADEKAAEMLRTARATLEKANTEANNVLSTAQQRATVLRTEAEQNAAADAINAKNSANDIISDAKQKTKAQRDETTAILNSATIQAAKMIEAANRKAEAIAGSAYEAMKNASLYEHTAKAMKNLIEGYGDKYIVPEQSLLDDLAESFSHMQAGQEFKCSRERTKVMIGNGTAAACEYVEANRRETAINFVVDAFNGKVDSILSRTKHDNSGKLDQQIRDAFTLVNFNGKAFRDARITDEYLEARRAELKWAAVTHQLALQEREEQRSAKEQAREEARAIKEQERALREAVKEEEMLQKALEQAQTQYDQASGEQKAMYEERLRGMEVRLKEALERKERARSMAELTKKGHVYIISNVGSFGDNVYKIGLTRRDDPFDRIRELGDSSVPFEFDVHAMILSDDAPALEYKLHRHFLLMQMNKVNHRKEFFRVSLKEIREEIEKLGLTTGVKWTMTGEAKEYRESLAIEQAIKESPAQREAWIKRQLRLELAAKENLEPAGEVDEDE